MMWTSFQQEIVDLEHCERFDSAYSKKINRVHSHKATSTIITARKRSLGQGNIFSSVCQEFCSQGEYLGRYTPGRYTPRQVHPPGQVHPPRQVHPLGRYTPWAGTPPRTGTPPRSSACWEIWATSRWYMHPTGMHSCCQIIFVITITTMCWGYHVWYTKLGQGWCQGQGHLVISLIFICLLHNDT